MRPCRHDAIERELISYAEEETRELKGQVTRLEQLVCDFQSAGLIDVGMMGGPCLVAPHHIEAHVTQLRADLEAARKLLGPCPAEHGERYTFAGMLVVPRCNKTRPCPHHDREAMEQKEG